MELFKIRDILKDQNKTSKELAEAIGFTQAGISKIVNGESMPRKETLIDIANYLGVDVGDLFVRTRERSNQDIAREIEELAREIR